MVMRKMCFSQRSFAKDKENVKFDVWNANMGIAQARVFLTSSLFTFKAESGLKNVERKPIKKFVNL